MAREECVGTFQTRHELVASPAFRTSWTRFLVNYPRGGALLR